MIKSFNKIEKVQGTLKFAGDKSVAHRALMISSLADGKSSIRNLPGNDDINSTINCLERLGVKTETSGDCFIITGKGFKGLAAPAELLSAGSSATTARLLTGVLSQQNFNSTISGTGSLLSRPMRRIIEPLTLMGCKIESNDGKLPLHIYHSEKIIPIRYSLPVASAQVKSAILFAGLHLEEETSVIEDRQTRNHTENLLGLKVVYENGKIISASSKKYFPEPKEYFLPGDISSAMFFIVLTLLTSNSELIIKDVLLNPARAEGLKLLKRMGGNIQIEERGSSNNELFGDVIVKSSQLSNVRIDKATIPQIIDEIPIISVAGIFAEGDFVIENAEELRVKESDRIKSMCKNFLLAGIQVEESDSGFRLSGDLKNARPVFKSFSDHRIAMSFAVLSCLLKNGGSVEGIESVSKSDPGFLKELKQVAKL